MANKFRNEMEIKLGPETILLRPTFENIASMEADIGGLGYLGWKFSRGMGKDADGKPVVTETTIKGMPTLTEVTKVIYHNQAEKKFSLDEIWQLVQLEGIALVKPMTVFLARISSGDKTKTDEVEVEEKKS